MVPGTTVPGGDPGLSQAGTGVTDLIGSGINMVTGDYPVARAGFGLRMGELAYPVEEITIAGNLKQMYATIETIGSDLGVSWTDRQPDGEDCRNDGRGKLTWIGRPVMRWSGQCPSASISGTWQASQESKEHIMALDAEFGKIMLQLITSRHEDRHWRKRIEKIA